MDFNVSELIQNYGALFYPIAFIWAALEGETFVIFAGIAAQRGWLEIELLFLAAGLGSFVGDQVFFLLGRKYGNRIVKRFPKVRPSVRYALRWCEKHAIGFILSYRFMYGVRNISGIAVGMTKISWRKFMLWNGIAAFLWSASFCAAGYAIGEFVSYVRPPEEAVHETVRDIMLIIVCVFVLYVLFRWISKRHYYNRIRKRHKKAGRG